MWKRQLSTTEMKREEMQNQVHSGGKLIILLEFARLASLSDNFVLTILDRPGGWYRIDKLSRSGPACTLFIFPTPIPGQTVIVEEG